MKKPRFKSQTAGAVVFLANQLKQLLTEQTHLVACWQRLQSVCPTLRLEQQS
jgi:hypothetical protein